MSRVEDDREEARLAERLLQQRRAEEARKTNKTAQDSQFARMVTQQKTEESKGEEQVTARSAIEEMLAASEAEGHDEVNTTEARQQSNDAEQRGFKSRLGTKQTDQKVSLGNRTVGQRAQSSKAAGDASDAAASQGRATDKAVAGKGAAGRNADNKSGREMLADRAKSSDESQDAQAGDGAGKEKGDLKTDADKGGGGKQQGGGDKKGDVPQGFRFNPALMAPVPVAQKNTTVGSDRLRRIASEIAQKIVERVRVGTNAAGNAEFQIDLRSNVLSGLQVKVSAKNGRISAVFSGSDKDVLKMLEEHEEALKGALQSRGLMLERFKVEAKA
jgi:hypothetical protein